MDKKQALEVIKTKQGKISIVFLVLSILSVVVCIMGTATISSGIAGFVVFLLIAGVFFLKGKKALENPTAPAAASAPAPEKIKFKPTKKVGKYLSVDDVNKKWCVPHSKESKAVYDYSDLLDYELIEDGNTVTSGSLGRAIAGGLAFGGLGAVIGGMTGKQKQTCNKLQIKITVKDMKHPVLYISLLSLEVKKDNDIYKTAINLAQEIVSILQLIKAENE